MIKEKECIKQYVERTISPIFDKVLKEIPKTPMSGLIKENSFKKFCMFQPHNYRLWFKYDKVSIRNLGGRVLFSCGHDQKSSIRNLGGRVLVSCGTINYGKEILFIFKDFDLRIKKKTIEVTYKNDKWYRVPIIIDCKSYFIDIIYNLEKKIIDFLDYFVCLWGGFTDFKIINRHSEDKIKSEDFINTIPERSRWDSELTKKVYYDKNVEFKGTVFASNYIHNQSLKENDSKHFDNLKHFTGIVSPLNFLKFYVNNLEDLLKYEKYYLLLSTKQKIIFSKWFFKLKSTK